MGSSKIYKKKTTKILDWQNTSNKLYTITHWTEIFPEVYNLKDKFKWMDVSAV